MIVPLANFARVLLVENQQDTVRKNSSMEQKQMVSNTKKNGYCIHHPLLCLKVPHIWLTKIGSVIGEITLTITKTVLLIKTMLTYLAHRQGLVLQQKLEEQINE